jgi:hypothetical protein
MRAAVTFHALWLVSERDASARKVTFSPNKNLLAGVNETGKSRILKHLVWALGCEPSARNAGGWDSNIACAVDLTISSKRYTFLRVSRKQRAAFDADGKLLIGTESAGAWTQFFADLFEFPLKLQRQQEGEFGLAGPEYAVLPFYIDQEGGWSRKWATFLYLGQFSRWEPLVFEAFTGLRPQRYFLAQLQRDEVVYKMREARMQAKLQARSYEQVTAMLPKTETQLDERLFAAELKELADRAGALAREENEARTALFEAAQERQEKLSELQMVSRAEQDLVEDLAYLSKVPDDKQLTCPTCGQVHGTSFRARVELATDAKDAHELVLTIRKQLDAVRDREHKLRTKLASVTASLEQIKAALLREKDGKAVGDIVAAKSRTTLELAYDRTRRDLAAQIDEHEDERKRLQEELDALTDKGREKRIRQEYKDELNSYADRLGIAKEEIGAIKIGARPPMGSGSSGPRIYLAMHMALLSVNKKYGDGPLFPFIVDTPRQQGLDDENMAKLLNAIYNESASHQIFVANESIPEGWKPPEGCLVLTFEHKRQLLRAEEYRNGVAALAPLVDQMRGAIKVEREAAEAAGEAPNNDGEILEESPSPASDDDSDDES